MQNRNIIWVFTILLTLACIYQLSFSWVTRSVEKEAESYAQSQVAMLPDTSVVEVANKKFKIRNANGEVDSLVVDDYKNALVESELKRKANQNVYLGNTYKDCKNKELALGLDLAGGMSVALEISVPDLLKNAAGRSERKNEFAKPFEAAYSAYTSKGNRKEFITLFGEKFNEMYPNQKLSNIFEIKDEDGNVINDPSNGTVLDALRQEASDALDKTKIIVESRINGLGVSQPSIQKNQSTGRLNIDLPGVKDKQRARDLLQGTARLEFWETYKNTEVGNLILGDVDRAISDRKFPGYRDSVDKAKADSNNTDSTQTDAVDNLTDADSGDSSLDDDPLADLDDLSADIEEEADKSKMYPLGSILYPMTDQQGRWTDGAVLGFAKVDDTSKINEYLALDYVRGMLPRDLSFMWENEIFRSPAIDNDDPILIEEKETIQLYLIKKPIQAKAALDGEQVTDARGGLDNGEAKVTLFFNAQGKAAWADMTETSAEQRRPIAITLDNRVLSAPIASNKIDGGVTEITGGSFMGENGLDQAKDLANKLNAGAFPVPAKIVDESLVGPTLGAANIKSGLSSFGIALLVVLLYMIFYYNKGGMVADLALIVNIFFIFGTLASLGAALTLPGIAGIVLTIGMSVDANVLVFERIREELRLGKGTKAAIDSGYSKALSAILDANITTLLTAIVLGYFGSGPVKGFAVTLIIGIFTSLFSALVITRLIFSYMMDGKRNITFSTKVTESLLTKVNVQFVAKRKIFYIISGLIIAGGIASLAKKGLDYGVEFTGGRTYKIALEGTEVDVPGLKEALKGAFGEEPEVKTVDNKYKALITTQYLLEDKTPEGNEKVEAALTKGVNKVASNFKIEESRQVDPGISSDFKASSLMAIVFSLIIIFLYIVLRFRKWQFGFGALLAMFHDVLIVLSLFSIFYGILPFSMEIDQAFIAAILTVVGYSINDTVVVFDRIREYLTERRRDDSNEVINKALNSTLSRTVNTSVTTFIVLLIIFLFGGESIKGMTFALMIGVVVGTYSSLCIATPSVVDLTKAFDFKKKQKL